MTSRGVEELERHVFGGQALGVVGHGDRRVGRPQVQAAGDGHDPLAGLGLDGRPGLVGALGQADVVGPVVGEPDDPAVVGRRAVGMAELEPLEAEDAGARARRGPVGGAGSERAEADDDEVPVRGRRPVGAWPDGRRGGLRPLGAFRSAGAVCARPCAMRVRMNVRTNLMLPEELVAAIDEVAGPRGRSRYVAEALERQIRRDRCTPAIKATAGAVEGPPALPDRRVRRRVGPGRARGRHRSVGRRARAMKYLLDSTFVIDHLRGGASGDRPASTRCTQAGDDPLVDERRRSAEVWAGRRTEGDPAIERLLRYLEYVQPGPSTARLAGEWRAEARERGRITGSRRRAHRRDGVRPRRRRPDAERPRLRADARSASRPTDRSAVVADLDRAPPGRRRRPCRPPDRAGRTSSEPTPWRIVSGRPSSPPMTTAAAPVASSSSDPEVVREEARPEQAGRPRRSRPRRRRRARSSAAGVSASTSAGAGVLADLERRATHSARARIQRQSRRRPRCGPPRPGTWSVVDRRSRAGGAATTCRRSDARRTPSPARA